MNDWKAKGRASQDHRVLVLGAGNFGTCLADHLAGKEGLLFGGGVFFFS